MAPIRFTAEPFTIGSWTILHLPKSASAKLPSRGMVMVEGTINGVDVQTPLEPDGKGSHWFSVEKSLQEDAGVRVGEGATLAIAPMKAWPDPALPADWKTALAANPTVQKLWKDITPIARWDWIRWIRMSKNPETRRKHIAVALSKMKGGMRRPCCFNRNMCTEPDVAKGGVLLPSSSA